MRPILVAAVAALFCGNVRAESDEALLLKMQRTVSLFECGHWDKTKEERRPFLDAGMKSGRAFLTALNGDRGLYDRIWGRIDFVFFYDSPTIDFQLGAAFAALGDRVSNAMEQSTKSVEEVNIAKSKAFVAKNCALIVR